MKDKLVGLAARFSVPVLALVTPATTLLLGGAALAMFGARDWGYLSTLLLLVPAFALPALLALGMAHRTTGVPLVWRRAAFLAPLAVGAFALASVAAANGELVLASALAGALGGFVLALPALPLLFPTRSPAWATVRILAGAALALPALGLLWGGIVFLSGGTDLFSVTLGLWFAACLVGATAVLFIIDGVAARQQPVAGREVDAARSAIDDAFVRRALDQDARGHRLARAEVIERELADARREVRFADATDAMARVLGVLSGIALACALVVLPAVLALVPPADRPSAREYYLANEAPIAVTTSGFVLGLGIVLFAVGVGGRAVCARLVEQMDGRVRRAVAEAQALREETLHDLRRVHP